MRSVSSPAAALAGFARSGIDYYTFVAANRPLIGFGIVTAFATSFGQTFFISLFVPAFLRSFGLGERGFGYLYAAATVASALLLPAVGAVIDRADLRRYTTFTVLGLAAAALTVAMAPNYVVLAVGIAGLRFTGQGLLGHISHTVMAKAFEKSRGKALGLASIGYPLGEAVLPITFALLLGVTDWRSAWWVVALASLALIAPLGLLARGPRHAAEAEALQGKAHSRRPAGSSEAFRDMRFYLMLVPVLLAPFILTGMFLYQIPFANSRGWPPELIAGAITVFAVVRAACSVAVGPLIDRWTARRLTPLFLLPLAAGLATLTLSHELWVPFAYLGLAGVTGGISGSVTSALWAEMFGVENIGRIRSVTAGLAILSTAASPVLVGTLLARGVNYDAIITSACLLLMAGCFAALPICVSGIRTSSMLRLILFSILTLPLFAQDRVGAVQVRVSTDRPDWRYEPGQPVRFRIVAVRDGHPLIGVKVNYRIGPEMMAPRVDQTATLIADGVVVDGGTMSEPGFLRCIATVEQNGRTYRGLATAAFNPEAIKPTQQDPADFDEFWAAGKAALAKLPIDARITPLPDYGNSAADCFHVNLQNVGVGNTASRLYGVLCEPKAPGKYPALLSVPGAGVRPYRGLAEMAAHGIITFQVGIHGIPVTMDQSVYDSLGAGALAGYNTFGLDNRDRYYYRRVYLGCVRANDFLTAHPKWDGVNLAVTGGSQGGALSIVTAALDPRVRGLAAYYPALSDVTGYLQNRAGGWPHMFRAAEGPQSHRSAEKIETSRYYDVVNFARRVKAPGLYSWGFNDETCPPTSMYSAYNVIPGPKKLLLALETGHNNVPEQTSEVLAWLEAFLRKGSTRN